MIFFHIADATGKLFVFVTAESRVKYFGSEL